ncbi:hypothetical protein EDF62_0140 [Leucobacter luti]|uniref:Uncharacterized protein n=1 Tax=Leucobacter luti TaxID=340320 RepID=A0A4R6S6X2_9MICO|nr:hypothetical protein [Leucobacter luti]TDP95451.1 hypothetical protein EDF62_0140 [Leucobacter luti]
MSEAGFVGDSRARLHGVAEALVRAYRTLCAHPGSTSPQTCASCEQIEEVRDMIRCTDDSPFEASALCAHFQQELRALRGPERVALDQRLGA